MTEERLEKLYWELGELEGNPYLLDWSDDDIKKLNTTKLNIWGVSNTRIFIRAKSLKK